MLGVVAPPMAFFGDLRGKDGVGFFVENKVEITPWFSDPSPSPAVVYPEEAGA